MPDLIYNQCSLAEVRYGLRSSARVGCGWVAAYNALTLMGYRVNREKLIRCFEGQLPLIHGNAGTSFWGPGAFFQSRGFPVEMLLKRDRFDSAAKEADVCILFYRWHRGMKFGAHFAALHHTEQGFVGYNTYQNSTGPDLYGESLDAFLKRRGYFGAVLTTIRKRAKK